MPGVPPTQRVGHRVRRGLVWPTATALVVAAVLPVLLLGWIADAAQRGALTERTTIDVEVVAAAESSHLEFVAATTVTNLRLVASRTQMREDLAALLGGDEGVRDRLARILDDARAAVPDFLAVAVTDVSGAVLLASGPGDVVEAGGLVASLDLDDPASLASRVVRVESTARWFAAMPLHLDGAPIGVVVVERDPVVLAHLIDGASLGGGIWTCTYHRTADGAAAPLQTSVGGSQTPCGGVGDDGATGAPVPADRVDVPATRALRGEATLAVDAVDARGREVVAATRYVEALDLGLVVSMELGALLEPVAASTRRNQFLTVVVGIVAVVAALAIASWLTRPIRQLRTVVEVVREGGEARADPTAPGELGELGEAFNEMAASVAAHRADLERRYEDLEILTHAMAHDLKGPLTTIRGAMSSLVEGRVRDDAQRDELLRRAVAASDRMQRLIDDLLALIRSIGAPLEMRAVPLDEVVDAVVADLDVGDVVSRTALPEVLGDRVLLEQLMMNLLDNAVTYHVPGRPPRVAISCDPPTGGSVAIHVDDAGVGIPAAEREVVRETFVRGDAGREHRGTGLGLPIVAKVVERHGGSLRIGDSPLGGARITVTLPVTGVAAAPAPLPSG